MLKFEGVNPRFVEALKAGGTLYMQRYAKLLDTIQYNNPPYVQVDMEKYLGIPFVPGWSEHPGTFSSPARSRAAPLPPGRAHRASGPTARGP